MNDEHYLRMAIARSRESMQKGKFPAAGMVMADYLGEPPTVSGISGDETDYRHGEIRAIEAAVEQIGRNLEGAVLYASMEPCLMCFMTAYWAGIRRIVYSIRRSEVDKSYYGSSIASSELNQSMDESIELVHLPDLESIALDIVREWEAAQ
jgi:guanine deaminase